ncbi:JmjC domain-containing protein [Candidatus Rariloculus sp.]|uniref:JmjC domain-containing protein n=1 Tax=Candidatus Rariloculus sp. TaxID=3101265 RepID=UPI003D153170
MAERPFAWSDIDQLLHSVEPRVPLMRMFHHGQVPEQAYTDDIVEPGRTRRVFNKAKFYEHMGRGATLVINWLEQHSVAAKRLCLEVGSFADTRTSSNAYLSFAGDGTFGQHWDTHDVFVIQLIGRKRWRIYPPTFPLPLTYQTNDTSGHTCPTEPALEVILEEGDVFYIPRGWWHHVIPLQGRQLPPLGGVLLADNVRLCRSDGGQIVRAGDRRPQGIFRGRLSGQRI